MTLTFSLLRATVMICSRARVQGQQSVGSEDRVETNGRADRRTDRWTEVIALPPSLKTPVNIHMRAECRRTRGEYPINLTSSYNFRGERNIIYERQWKLYVMVSYMFDSPFSIVSRLLYCVNEHETGSQLHDIFVQFEVIKTACQLRNAICIIINFFGDVAGWLFDLIWCWLNVWLCALTLRMRAILTSCFSFLLLLLFCCYTHLCE